MPRLSQVLGAVQTPATQLAVPVHRRPQAPQLAESLVRLTQEPEQLVVGAEHESGQAPQSPGQDPQVSLPLHVPSPQRAVGCAMHEPETHTPLQRAPHAPQLFTSRLVLVSQPFATLPSQFAVPAEQVTVHAPQSAAQVPQVSPLSQRPLPHTGPMGAFGAQRPAVQVKPALQRAPQLPQLALSAERLVSQPLPSFPSQFAAGALQVRGGGGVTLVPVQTPRTQV
jgi:hypothetical protein